MSEHVVVAVEACAPAQREQCGRWLVPPCRGCLGDGTRAVLDSAVPVTFTVIDGKSFAIEQEDVECYREVAP